MGKNGKPRDDSKPAETSEAATKKVSAKLADDFNLDDPKFPKALDDAAMTSGGYPYDKKLKREDFEDELKRLQIELCKLQAHNLKTGGRIVILFEGRDGAGKGTCINAFSQHLNPRNTRTVALSKPT